MQSRRAFRFSCHPFSGYCVVGVAFFVTVFSGCPPTPSFSVDIDRPTVGSSFEQGASVVLRGTVTSGDASVSIRWIVDGADLGTGQVSGQNPFVTTIVFETDGTTALGSHSVRLEATQASGATQSDTAAFDVVMPTVDPNEGSGEGAGEGSGEGLGEGSTEGVGEAPASFQVAFGAVGRQIEFVAAIEAVLVFKQDGGAAEIGYVALGTDYPEGEDTDGGDIVVARFDAFGALVDTFTYGGVATDIAADFSVAADGGWAIVGSTRSIGAGSSDAFLVRTDATGGIQYQATFGGTGIDLASAIETTTDGGFIIAGETFSFGAGSSDVFLIRVDSDGITQWEATFGGGDRDFGRAVIETSDGGFVVVGTTEPSEIGDSDVYLVKTNSGGDLVFEQSIGSAEMDEEGRAICELADGSFIIAGVQKSLSTGANNIYVVRARPDGTLSRSVVYVGEEAEAMIPTGDGFYVVVGHKSRVFGQIADAYLMRIDSGGNRSGEYFYGGAGIDVGLNVGMTSDGGYLISGSTRSFGPGSTFNAYLVKTDAAGVSEETPE